MWRRQGSRLRLLGTLHRQLYGGVWNHIFSSSFYNQARAGFQRARGSRYGEDDTNPFNQTYGIPAFTDTVPNNGGIPYTVITGYSTLGSYVNLPQDSRGNTFDFSDDLFLTKGRHSVKIGATFTRFSSPSTAAASSASPAPSAQAGPATPLPTLPSACPPPRFAFPPLPSATSAPTTSPPTPRTPERPHPGSP